MSCSASDILRILPLGGIGEIGKNMTVFEYGDQIVVIDCGLMFPEEEMFGVDFVVPDITYLKDRRHMVKAFLITHAHEDHVGGLPFILPEFPGVPVYAVARARVLGNKIKEHKLTNNPLLAFDPGETVEVGAFTATAFRIGHSIPDAMGIALRTRSASSSTRVISSSTTPRSTERCQTSTRLQSSAAKASCA